MNTMDEQFIVMIDRNPRHSILRTDRGFDVSRTETYQRGLWSSVSLHVLKVSTLHFYDWTDWTSQGPLFNNPDKFCC